MPAGAQLLSGRKALVTGADSGIGQGVAFELAAHGAAVAVNYLADSAVAEGMVDRSEGAGGRHHVPLRAIAERLRGMAVRN